MSSKKVLTSTLWQMASQAIMAMMSIVSSKLVAVALSKELVGYYNSSYGYLQIFGILADFGLYAVAVKELSKAPEHRRSVVLSSLLVLRTCMIFLSLGTALLIAYSIPSWTSTPLRTSILLAALVPFFTLLAGVFRTVFQVTYTMHVVFIAETIQRVLTVLCMLGLVFGLHMTASENQSHLFLLIGAGGLGALFLFLFSSLFSLRFHPFTFSFERDECMLIFKRSLPFGLAFLATALYRQSDVSFIAYLRDDFAILNAEYGFAQRIAEMAYLVPTFLLNSTLPILSTRIDNGEDTRVMMGKTLFLILLLSITSALFAFFWARPLIQLLTSSAYLSTATAVGSDTALARLSIPMFLNGFIVFSFYSLLALHRSKALVWSMALGVLCSLSLNLFLIPSLGFIGATISSSVTHLLLATVLFPQALRAVPVSLPEKWWLSLLMFSALLALLLFLTAPFLLSTFSIIIGCLLVGLFTIFGAMSILKWHTIL